MKNTLRHFAYILLFLMMTPSGEARADSRLEGHIECSLTGTKFPGSVGEPLMVTYTGSMEVEADGNGRFLQGHMTTKAAEEGSTRYRPCEFNLIEGKYALNQDRTGTSVTSWAYWEGGGNTGSD